MIEIAGLDIEVDRLHEVGGIEIGIGIEIRGEMMGEPQGIQEVRGGMIDLEIEIEAGRGVSLYYLQFREQSLTTKLVQMVRENREIGQERGREIEKEREIPDADRREVGVQGPRGKTIGGTEIEMPIVQGKEKIPGPL